MEGAEMTNILNPEGDLATRYSAPWTGQDGRQWRKKSIWCFPGWRDFLEVQINCVWRGW
jgi:hypothetical protein